MLLGVVGVARGPAEFGPRSSARSAACRPIPHDGRVPHVHLPSFPRLLEGLSLLVSARTRAQLGARTFL